MLQVPWFLVIKRGVFDRDLFGMRVLREEKAQTVFKRTRIWSNDGSRFKWTQITSDNQENSIAGFWS